MAAREGCHLFIEKPVAHALEGVDELREEVRTRGLATLVGCNFRFHPGLRHVKTLLEDDAIGTVVSARAQFGQYLPDWHPWEDYRLGYSAQKSLGGGVTLDRIHEIDYLRWLLGDVTEVCAMIGRLSHLEIDTEDTAEILLRFASGAFASIHLDYVRRTYDCSLEIVGEEGTVHWSYQDHRVRWRLAGQDSWQVLEWPGYDGNDMYVDELRHFLRVLGGEESSELDAAEGARVLAIAWAAKVGATEKRTVAL